MVCSHFILPVLECSQRCSTSCWELYLATHIQSRSVVGLKCIGDECMRPLPERFIRRHTTPELYTKWADFFVSSFADENPNIRCCLAVASPHTCHVAHAACGPQLVPSPWLWARGCERRAHLSRFSRGVHLWRHLLLPVLPPSSAQPSALWRPRGVGQKGTGVL